MPNPNTEQLEREAAKRPVTDQQHQPDQSLHQLEIERLRQQQDQSHHDDHDGESQLQSQTQSQS
jgi:hypothetical protein